MTVLGGYLHMSSGSPLSPTGVVFATHHETLYHLVKLVHCHMSNSLSSRLELLVRISELRC